MIVRVIAAANQDLRQLVLDRRFREDLFHRLDLFRIQIPPLRQRGEDILRLAESLMQRLTRRHRLPKREFSPLGRKRLLGYAWPGNVRELENAIERAVLVAKGSDIGVADLPETIRQTGEAAVDFVIPPHRTLAEIEKAAIVQTLQRTNWNKQEAAQILGLYRPTLYSKMKKHEVRAPGRAGRVAAAPPADAS